MKYSCRILFVRYFCEAFAYQVSQHVNMNNLSIDFSVYLSCFWTTWKEGEKSGDAEQWRNEQDKGD